MPRKAIAQLIGKVRKSLLCLCTLRQKCRLQECLLCAAHVLCHKGSCLLHSL